MGIQDNRSIATGRGDGVHDLGYTPAEISALTIARFYFSTFAEPQKQDWIGALGAALAAFGVERGPHVAMAVLSAVQTMRRSRASMFKFNCPECDMCSAQVTPHERSFMSALRSMARGNPAASERYATLLCEGNDTTGFAHALQVLVDAADLEQDLDPMQRDWS